jgi:hypothetical protein
VADCKKNEQPTKLFHLLRKLLIRLILTSKSKMALPVFSWELVDNMNAGSLEWLLSNYQVEHDVLSDRGKELCTPKNLWEVYQNRVIAIPGHRAVQELHPLELRKIKVSN